MYDIQKFALENIYCSPGQDRQFSFKLIRANDVNRPITRVASVFNTRKSLPNIYSHYPDVYNRYHVFTIGNVSPSFINLLKQGRQWFKDVWVNVASDMVLRKYILKVYNDKGEVYPSNYVYYSHLDENNILIAIEFDRILESKFDVGSFIYVHVYSNEYFSTAEYAALPVMSGIQYAIKYVTNNVDKAGIQAIANNYQINGGKSIIYVNGRYTDNVNLNIPDFSYVEVIYDQSIMSKEIFPISSLRTFNSIMDNKLKYLIYRYSITNSIQFYDDTEIYISDAGALVTTGLYYYKHKDFSVRNVTDKDYSLFTTYVNNTAQIITDLTTGSIADKVIVLFTRKSGLSRTLKYSSLKLHELYKLPHPVEKDVISNTSYTITELRAEALENSNYFKVASLPYIHDLTPELAANTLGYNGITYYFAYTPQKVIPLGIINVPLLYQQASTVFEYSAIGQYLGTYTTTGPAYILTNPTAKYVEFLYGVTPVNFGMLYSYNSTFTLLHNEYKILSAVFTGVTQGSIWTDITNDPVLVTVVGNQVTLNELPTRKVKVVYFNQPNVYTDYVPLINGELYFPLTIKEDRGSGVSFNTVDTFYANVELYLNGYKLMQGLDYFMNYPYVSICNKSYINYTLPAQEVHIRMYGYTGSVDLINQTETSGFISNGVLLRNGKYDLQEDKVLSIYIDGKLQDRASVLFAEIDSTVRVVDVLNGLPYIIKEPFMPVKSITSVDTIPLRDYNIQLNKKISDLFTVIMPEVPVLGTQIIATTRQLYSPVINKIIINIKNGTIPSSAYTNPYGANDILLLLASSPYKELLQLDPLKASLPSTLATIYPHSGNTLVSLDLYQYRYVESVINEVTLNHPELVTVAGSIVSTV